MTSKPLNARADIERTFIREQREAHRGHLRASTTKVRLPDKRVDTFIHGPLLPPAAILFRRQQSAVETRQSLPVPANRFDSRPAFDKLENSNPHSLRHAQRRRLIPRPRKEGGCLSTRLQVREEMLLQAQQPRTPTQQIANAVPRSIHSIRCRRENIGREPPAEGARNANHELTTAVTTQRCDGGLHSERALQGPAKVVSRGRGP